jgi:hypothetical protein
MIGDPRVRRTARAAAVGGRRARRCAAGLVGLSWGLLACALDVNDPDVVTPGDLGGAAGAATLYAGALGDFALAYGGDAGVREGQILVTGLFADEFVHSGNEPGRRDYDRRAVADDNPNAAVFYTNLHRARRAAEVAAGALAELEDAAGDPRVGEMWSLAGFTYVFFAEAYCSGVPYSEVVDGRLVPGEPTTTEETLARALERFDRAAAATGGDEGIGSLARVGRARALLALGRPAEAAAAVAPVPTAFAHEVEYSENTPLQENGVHNFTVVYERWSLADREGGNGLAYRSAADPRVPWTRTPADDVGFDQVTPQYDLLKYPARDAPIPLATGAEARLIEAEGALAANDPTTFLARLDEVRARHGLGPVTDPGDADGRVALLFRERAFELFASGHRLGDLRRLVRQHGRPPGSVFPSGVYPAGGSYGDALDLPVPDAERSNPLFRGCLARGP